MIIKNNEKGQSLIEVLIALAASVAVVTAIAITVITSLANVEFTKNQNLASQYSREGMEVVRKIAKDNWGNFISTYTSVNYCLDDNSNTLRVMGAGGCGQNVDIFVRQIVINQTSPSCENSVRISSNVSWSDSKCTSANPFCHTITIDSCLADINTIQAP